MTSLRALWADQKITYAIRILLSMLGVVLPCWYFQDMDAVSPLIFGVIAAALSETSDSLLGRVRQWITMILCFALAVFSIEFLFDFPVLFTLGLGLSTFCFIMLGAIGARYARIAFSSLLIAVYAMLGAAESNDLFTQPVLLLTGACWSSFVAFLWQLIWPNQALQQSLAQLFKSLDKYLRLKAKLFEPVAGLSPHDQRVKLAKLNSQVVSDLNNTKQMILHRVKRGRTVRSNSYLKLYLLAQDIHERISSSHYRYNELGEIFKHSDVLFRFHWLTLMQAKACGQLGKAIQQGKPYQHNHLVSQALDDASESLVYLRRAYKPQWLEALTSLKFLWRNLASIEKHLQQADDPQLINNEDNQLVDHEVHNIKAMWQRFFGAMSAKSVVFRHAVRLSSSLMVGYGVIQALELERGYWILLTILFVCQPNFGATRLRLYQRLIGTVTGLIVGVPLLYLFPGQEGQLVLMVCCGVAFFASREKHYGWATSFMTLLVLFCFSQLGDGYAVILPRLGDTFAGAVLAVLAVRFILPDWQVAHLPSVLANAISRNGDYLAQNIEQYASGKKDDLAYRSARRRAHNADVALSTTVSNMLQEPEKYQVKQDEYFRMLVLNHSLLGYISALGAHRNKLAEDETCTLIEWAHNAIQARLAHIRLIFLGENVAVYEENDRKMLMKLAKWNEEGGETSKLVRQQLFMIHRMLDEMDDLAKRLA